MKKLFALALVLLAVRCHAGTTNAIGGLVSLNGTNTAKFPGATVTLTPGKFFFQNGGGLGSTNAFRGDVYISLDNTNWVKIGVYRPAGTAATNEAYSQPSTNLTIYFRVDAVTTNTYSVGMIYQN